MNSNWKILQAMQYCPYKAWQLSRETDKVSEIPHLPSSKISVALMAYALSLSDDVEQSVYLLQIHSGNEMLPQTIRIKPSVKAETLLAETRKTIDCDAQAFYKNKHCPECQFKVACHQKLGKDCISLLGSISPKIIAKYHKRGIPSFSYPICFALAGVAAASLKLPVIICGNSRR
jgi:hypothetical protein